MRAYFLCNQYLSSIQCGIQSAHVVAEMFTKYKRKDDPGREALWLWAKKHKTMVLLNGGYQSELEEFYDFLDDDDTPEEYVYAAFREEHDSLNGAMTSVGIVVPAKICEAIAGVRETDFVPTFENLSNWELELIRRLAKFGLAR